MLSDSKTKMVPSPKRGVSMHLLVFSAFRLIADVSEVKEYKSQCIFWCSVLSDRNDGSVRGGFHGFQCTFWCSVLSDVKPANEFGTAVAFQCTFWCSVLSDPTERKWNSGKVNFVSMHLLVLSAFRRVCGSWHRGFLFYVSMHLLVLSAFRLEKATQWTLDQMAFQCTFWCSVLSDTAARRPVPRRCPGFQCTFWCSVLSDVEGHFRERCDRVEFQCTFWCSVLSDKTKRCDVTEGWNGFQCTFWCSVLSDLTI